MKIDGLPPYENAQITELIDKHVHDKRARTALKLRLCDKMIYADIADHPDVQRSVRWVGYILNKHLPILAQYL